MTLQQKAPSLRSLLVVLAAVLPACASVPPARTVQLRAFLGASEDGSWAFAEVNEFPGSPASGQVHVVGPDSKPRTSTSIPPALAADAVSHAVAAGESTARTAEAALAALRPEGFEMAKAAALPPLTLGGPRQALPHPAVPAEAELRREDGEVRLMVRLASGAEELAAYRLPVAGTTWIGEVRLLPGGRRALAFTGAATVTRTDVFRLEGLGEVDLGSAVAALLDSRGVQSIQAGDLAKATADLLQAIAIAPDDATSHYNLACAYALADSLDEAILSLGRAVELDPERLKPMALSDPDLSSLHGRVEFRLMVEPRLPGTVP
ncbi:MAG: tetratricopeptide repeat protein [Myxococcales bacterium]